MFCFQACWSFPLFDQILLKLSNKSFSSVIILFISWISIWFFKNVSIFCQVSHFAPVLFSKFYLI